MAGPGQILTLYFSRIACKFRGIFEKKKPYPIARGIGPKGVPRNKSPFILACCFWPIDLFLANYIELMIFEGNLGIKGN